MRVSGVNVTVGVRPPLVGVQMDVEEPAPPPHQQPDGERDDDDADQRLGSLLDALRQVRLEQDERQAEGEERRRVAARPRRRRAGTPWRAPRPRSGRRAAS